LAVQSALGTNFIAAFDAAPENDNEIDAAAVAAQRRKRRFAASLAAVMIMAAAVTGYIRHAEAREAHDATFAFRV
jgi:hypothetical protein